MIAEMPVQANSMQGRTFDCGSKLGYILANIRYGLVHPEIGEGLADDILQVIGRYEQDYPNLRTYSDDYPSVGFRTPALGARSISPCFVMARSEEGEG